MWRINWVGPHLPTTLECTILAVVVELTRAGVEKDCERADGGGGDWLWSVEATAAVNPNDRRAEGKRRRVEENSLKVFLGKRERLYFRERKGSGPIMRSESNSVSFRRYKLIICPRRGPSLSKHAHVSRSRPAYVVL